MTVQANEVIPMAVQPKASSIQRAIRKATDTRAFATVEPITATEWFVRGGRSWYIVAREQGGWWSCTCEAGTRGLACYHQAAVWLAQARDSMMAGTSRAN